MDLEHLEIPKKVLFSNFYSHNSKEYLIEFRSSIPHDIFVALEISDAVHRDIALRIEVLQIHLFDAHKPDLKSVTHMHVSRRAHTDPHIQLRTLLDCTWSRGGVC